MKVDSGEIRLIHGKWSIEKSFDDLVNGTKRDRDPFIYYTQKVSIPRSYISDGCFYNISVNEIKYQGDKLSLARSKFKSNFIKCVTVDNGFIIYFKKPIDIEISYIQNSSDKRN